MEYEDIEMSDEGEMDLEESDEIASSSAANSPPQTKRFVVKKWHCRALWAWDVIVDDCAICRNQIMEPCIECQAKAPCKPGEECTEAWGACNHVFHFHCIDRWLKTRQVCPLDNEKWVYKKNGR